MVPEGKGGPEERHTVRGSRESGARKVCRYTLEPSASSLFTVREFIRTTLSPHPTTEPFVNDIVCATHEACKNAVIHNPETECPVDVFCELKDRSVVVEVADRGDGFDPVILPPSPPDPEALEGRGFYMMYGLMDDVSARTNKDGTRIRMQKDIGKRA